MSKDSGKTAATLLGVSEEVAGAYLGARGFHGDAISLLLHLTRDARHERASEASEFDRNQSELNRAGFVNNLLARRLKTAFLQAGKLFAKQEVEALAIAGFLADADLHLMLPPLDAFKDDSVTFSFDDNPEPNKPKFNLLSDRLFFDFSGASRCVFTTTFFHEFVTEGKALLFAQGGERMKLKESMAKGISYQRICKAAHPLLGIDDSKPYFIPCPTGKLYYCANYFCGTGVTKIEVQDILPLSWQLSVILKAVSYMERLERGCWFIPKETPKEWSSFLDSVVSRIRNSSDMFFDTSALSSRYADTCLLIKSELEQGTLTHGKKTAGEIDPLAYCFVTQADLLSEVSRSVNERLRNA